MSQRVFLFVILAVSQSLNSLNFHHEPTVLRYNDIINAIGVVLLFLRCEKLKS
jgi:hypothetical protein